VGLALAATIMAVFSIAGSSRISGPVILGLTSSHGVHLDDLIVLTCWVACMAWCWRLWVESR
jgi:hypothetical protein